MSQAHHVFKPGDVIMGRYVIVEWIGAGGMADVYKAYDKNMEDHVALKATLPEHLPSPEQAKLMAIMMAKEAKRGGRIYKRLSRHGRYVVPVTDTGITDLHSLPFCVMELLHGSALSDQIASRRLARNPFKIHVVLRIARGIAIGLGYIHTEKYIHRDIKPGNIWLSTPENSDEWDVLICDMGLLFAMLEDESDGLFKGTPRYACPSLFSLHTPTPAVDVYALGLLIYEMLVGKGPWDVGSRDNPIPPKGDLETWSGMHREVTPRRLREGNEAIPTAVEDLVMRMIHKTPSERPTMKQVYVELERLLGALPAGQASDFSLVKIPPAARQVGETSEGQLHRLMKMAQNGTLIMGKPSPADARPRSGEPVNSVTGAAKTRPPRAQPPQIERVDPRKADTRSMVGVVEFARAYQRDADTLDPVIPPDVRPSTATTPEPEGEDPSRVYFDQERPNGRPQSGAVRPNAGTVPVDEVRPADDVDGLLHGVGGGHAAPPPTSAVAAQPAQQTAPQNTTRFESSPLEAQPAQSPTRPVPPVVVVASEDGSGTVPLANVDGSMFDCTPTQNLAFDLLVSGAEVSFVARTTSLPTAHVETFHTWIHHQTRRWDYVASATNQEIYNLCHEFTGRQLACDLLCRMGNLEGIARRAKLSVDDVCHIDAWRKRLLGKREEYEKLKLSPDAIAARYREPPANPTPVDAAMDVGVPDDVPVILPKREWYAATAFRVAIAASFAVLIPTAIYEVRTTWGELASRPAPQSAAAAEPSQVLVPLPNAQTIPESTALAPVVAPSPPPTATERLAPPEPVAAHSPAVAKRATSATMAPPKPAQTMSKEIFGLSDEAPPTSARPPTTPAPSNAAVDKKRLLQLVLEEDSPPTAPKPKPAKPAPTVALPTESIQ